MAASKLSEKLKLKSGDQNSKATSKANKISEAQQYMLLAVFGAGVFLGAAVAFIMHFVNQISFNANVIAEEEATVVTLSDTIRDLGVCTSPKGKIYTDAEIDSCNPSNIDVASIPDTLRANVLQNMAANKALNSVPKESLSYCVNPETNKNFTYEELNEFYASAETAETRAAATQLIQICSALRIIPDALPSYRNEEALLSSLNRIFIMSNWEPEELSPTGTFDQASFGNNLYTIPIQLSVDADAATTMNVLDNIERSIRDFDVTHASIEWSGASSITLNSEFNAYYTLPSAVNEETKTIKFGAATTSDSADEGVSEWKKQI